MQRTIFVSLIEADGVDAAFALQRWGHPPSATPLSAPPGRGPRASLVCRALLLGLLAEVTETASESWRLETEGSGRPRALAKSGPAPCISMSHSGAWVACALTFNGSVGIDIEQGRPERDLSGIAAASFGPAETTRAGRDGDAGFYRLWTLREAMAKANGQGLAMVADRRDRVAEGPDQGSWWARVDDADWWLMHRRPMPNLSLALALRDADRSAADTRIPLTWWRPRH